MASKPGDPRKILHRDPRVFVDQKDRTWAELPPVVVPVAEKGETQGHARWTRCRADHPDAEWELNGQWYKLSIIAPYPTKKTAKKASLPKQDQQAAHQMSSNGMPRRGLAKRIPRTGKRRQRLTDVE